MREVVVDTETTGLSLRNRDRIIEIACLELINHQPTSRTFHRYVNPNGKKVTKTAFGIHHLSNEFLENFPTFDEIAEDVCEFIKDDILVIHNARFDIKFINNEFQKLNIPEISLDQVVDTKRMAKKRYPWISSSLDSLCDHFDIDRSSRANGHGALIDAKLLVQVYNKMIMERTVRTRYYVKQTLDENSVTHINNNKDANENSSDSNTKDSSPVVVERNESQNSMSMESECVVGKSANDTINIQDCQIVARKQISELIGNECESTKNNSNEVEVGIAKK